MADSLLPEADLAPDERQELRDKWAGKSREEILESKIDSDLYIKSQNARFDDIKGDYLKLREEQAASEQLKVLIDRLEKAQATEKTQNTQRETVIPAAIKPEDIESIFDKRFNEKTLEQRQRENFNYAQTKLQEQYGKDYAAAYKQKLDQLGITKEFADELAKSQPSVFMKTFDLDAQPLRTPFQAPPRSDQRASSFAPNSPKRDWLYYQEMKKTNPKMYLDPKIAVQMHDDAIALGDAFGMPQD